MNTIYFHTCETRPEFFPYYRVCWNSLLSVLRDERVVVINRGAAPALIAEIPKRFEVVSPRVVYAGIYYAFAYHLERWHIMQGNPDDLIIALDCRDMFFQRNPFDDLKPGLTVLGEGVAHSDCPWNIDDQTNIRKNIAPSIPRPMAPWQVLCPAVYGGTRRMVNWAILMVGHMGTMQLHGGTDQGSLNYIVNQYLLGNDPDVRIADHRTCDLCLGGYDIGVTGCFEENGKVMCKATGRPYALFHQWDRTQWKDQYLSRWSGRHLNIISPVSRPENIPAMRDTIVRLLAGQLAWRVTWIVVEDRDTTSCVIEPADRLEIVHRALPSVKDGNRISVSGNAQRNLGLDLAAYGWVYFLDDDTLMHIDLLKHIEPICAANPSCNIVVSQIHVGGSPRLTASAENMKVTQVDSGQVILRREFIGSRRWYPMDYSSDGFFICDAYRAHPESFIFLDKALSVYNVLR